MAIEGIRNRFNGQLFNAHTDMSSADLSEPFLVRCPNITMEQFLQEPFKDSTLSLEEQKKLREYLIHFCNNFNGQLHVIRKDGNWYTTAFATSLMYVMIARKDMINRVFSVISDLLKNRPFIEKQFQEVMRGIQELREKGRLVLDELLTNNSFMKSFSYIIRIFLNESFRQRKSYSPDKADRYVPIEDGKSIDTRFDVVVYDLSKFLNLNSYTYTVSGFESVEYRKKRLRSKPDIVFIYERNINLPLGKEELFILSFIPVYLLDSSSYKKNV